MTRTILTVFFLRHGVYIVILFFTFEIRILCLVYLSHFGDILCTPGCQSWSKSVFLKSSWLIFPLSQLKKTDVLMLSPTSI